MSYFQVLKPNGEIDAYDAVITSSGFEKRTSLDISEQTVSFTELSADTSYDVTLTLQNGVGSLVLSTSASTSPAEIEDIPDTSSSTSADDNMSAGTAAGVAIGIVALVILVLAAVIYARSRQSKVVDMEPIAAIPLKNMARDPFWLKIESSLEMKPHMKSYPRNAVRRRNSRSFQDSPYMRPSILRTIDQDEMSDYGTPAPLRPYSGQRYAQPDILPVDISTGSGGMQAPANQLQDTLNIMLAEPRQQRPAPNRRNSLRDYAADSLYHANAFNTHVDEPPDISQSTDGGYLHITPSASRQTLPVFAESQPTFTANVGADTAQGFSFYEEDTAL